MTATRNYTREDLINLKPRHPTFVGIDSDGCVFPTMEIKQRKCFHTAIISHWRLEKIAKYLRETSEFVSLYSKWRGTNRFIAILKMFDLLRERKEVVESGVKLPQLPELRKFVDSGAALGNPELEKAVRETGSEELKDVLKWSRDVNALIAGTVKNIPPFKFVRESFDRILENSDAICVSQTPTEALVREWEEHNLVKYVSVIAGQELGTKTEHIAMAAGGKYPPEKILMLGDAQGDWKAAKSNHALFFPINPGKEEESWERFRKEGYDKFLTGGFAGKYEEKLIAEFEALLPDTPAWKTAGPRTSSAARKP